MISTKKISKGQIEDVSAIIKDGSTPVLADGITAAAIRTLIEAGSMNAWGLDVNGVVKAAITSGERVDFEAGTGITIAHANVGDNSKLIISVDVSSMSLDLDDIANSATRFALTNGVQNISGDKTFLGTTTFGNIDLDDNDISNVQSIEIGGWTLSENLAGSLIFERGGSTKVEIESDGTIKALGFEFI